MQREGWLCFSSNILADVKRKSVRRVAIVLLATLITAGVVTYFLDLPRGIALGFLSIALWTLMTIPDDLQPGEYDLFGVGVLALMIVVGLIALALKPDGPRYYKGDNPPPSHAWPD